jgi:hypothetical protein
VVLVKVSHQFSQMVVLVEVALMQALLLELPLSQEVQAADLETVVDLVHQIRGTVEVAVELEELEKML